MRPSPGTVFSCVPCLKKERLCGDDGDAELLVHFSYEGIVDSLARFDAASREAPLARKDSAIGWHLAEENAPVVVTDDGDDDHACHRRVMASSIHCKDLAPARRNVRRLPVGIAEVHQNPSQPGKLPPRDTPL